MLNDVLGVFVQMIAGQFFCVPKTDAAKAQTKIIDETANGANNSGMSDP